MTRHPNTLSVSVSQSLLCLVSRKTPSKTFKIFAQHHLNYAQYTSVCHILVPAFASKARAYKSGGVYYWLPKINNIFSVSVMVI
jgi:hypothetical protein